MPNSTEVAVELAKKLEQQIFLTKLMECHTLEDYEDLKREYQELCKINFS